MVSLYRSWSLVQQGASREARDYNHNRNNQNHNHNHHHHHNPFSLFRSNTRASSRDSFAYSFGYQTPSEDLTALTSPSPVHVSQLSYSDQLEDYIVRYKRRPPDIKHWPYGPYWPRHFDGLLLNTPRHLWSAPREPELLAKDDFGRRLHGRG
ncbi:cytosolic carboxypeptidase 2 [Elysia marginata]|uniref:Cytosolic carboxypeptidase 2 n=1 Tax=Elysia marginata TaxID=1093978 RepID=A0AAV4IPI2_9GAST|nr:cytosolic carboxypeptidase 2 [Elysia marginata]